MSHTSEKKLVLVAAWGFVLTGLVLVSQRTLRAEEPKSTDGQTNQCQIRLEVRGKLPILEKIPLVKYFVSSGEESTECVASCNKCDPNVDRIGVDFDVLPGHMVAYLANGERQVICTEKNCASCPRDGVCFDTKVAASHCQACLEWQCEPCTESTTAVAQWKVKPAQTCPALQQACDTGHHHQVCEQVAAVRAENAALNAAHAAHESMEEARNELFEAMLAITVEKAKLESKLEWMAERDQMREKLLEMQSEIGKLRAQAELAEARHSLTAKSMEIALENERLKMRVVELEERDPSSSAPKRTAKKPTTKMQLK